MQTRSLWMLGMGWFCFLNMCSYAEARTQPKVAVVMKQVTPLMRDSSAAIRSMIEGELRRQGNSVVSLPSKWQGPTSAEHSQWLLGRGVQFIYEVTLRTFAGQVLLEMTEFNVSPRREHTSVSRTIDSLRALPDVLPGMCKDLLHRAQKGRVKHSTFRWGLGVAGGLAIGFDSRPDSHLHYPGGLAGGLVRFSFEVQSFRIDLESSFLAGYNNHFTEIVALRGVYHPFLTNLSPYIGIGASFIAAPTMFDGVSPPMFGVGMSINAGYEFFRMGDVHFLFELQINFPFLAVCGLEEDPLSSGAEHDHNNHTENEFDIWTPSAVLKFVVMW